ncbi:MAG TPA: thiamine diphosphokinase [Chloroflexia bacterium]|nr:thiamine diphosphokinase [Chloroflexia bacterium]
MSERQDSSTAVRRGTVVWVLASSPTWPVHGSVEWLPAPQKVVAADGGTTLAAALGVVPDLIIGDLDSSEMALVQRFVEQGAETATYQHTTKLETDTELAALAALRWNPASIYVLGGTGGRLDHALANILMLTHPELAERDVRIIEGQQAIYLGKPGRWNDLRGTPGDTVSLLPLGTDVEGVRTEGLEYPLSGETLLEGRGRGVSNTITGTLGRVWFETGQLLIVHTHFALVKGGQ